MAGGESYRKKECNREMANKYILGWIHRRIPLSVSGLSVSMQAAMAAEERHDANIVLMNSRICGAKSWESSLSQCWWALSTGSQENHFRSPTHGRIRCSAKIYQNRNERLPPGSQCLISTPLLWKKSGLVFSKPSRKARAQRFCVISSAHAKAQSRWLSVPSPRAWSLFLAVPQLVLCFCTQTCSESHSWGPHLGLWSC